MRLSKALADEVRAAIERDPLVAGELLDLVRESLSSWEARVRASLDKNADIGISAALGLPVWKSQDWLNLENPKHRSWARMTAVGWNLHRRRATSGIEKSLVEFVMAADSEDPESAESHYRTLLSHEPGAFRFPQYRV